MAPSSSLLFTLLCHFPPTSLYLSCLLACPERVTSAPPSFRSLHVTHSTLSSPTSSVSERPYQRSDSSTLGSRRSSPLDRGFISCGFSYPWPENIKWRNSRNKQHICFKLHTVLSSVRKPRVIVPHLRRDSSLSPASPHCICSLLISH